MCFSCGRILVALFCTFSKASMRDFRFNTRRAEKRKKSVLDGGDAGVQYKCSPRDLGGVHTGWAWEQPQVRVPVSTASCGTRAGRGT